MVVCPHEIEQIKYHGHVTLDWDGATEPPRKFYLYGGKDSPMIECIHWRTSSSRRGLHILVCLRDDMTPLEKFLFRMWNHDDIWRLSYDILRFDESMTFHHAVVSYAEGTLFDIKDGKKVSQWRD